MIAVLLFLLSTTYIDALPQGAPRKVCDTMRPSHGQGTIRPQNSESPYLMHLRRHNGAVIVTLRSPLGIPLQGFMLQARTPSRELLGSFQPKGSAHTLDCAHSGDTITHNGPESKEAIEAEWSPPSDYEGPVIFNSTVLQNYQTFWVGVESQPVQVGKRAVNDPIPNFPNTRRSTTPPNFFPEVTRESETVFDPFYEGCAVTKLCFGSPANCVSSKNCKAVVAVTVTGEKYEFEMKATGNAAWVGVGLSEDDKMGDDSVIECVKRGSSSVGAYMSWTAAPPNKYGAARLSNPQLGIQLLNGSIINDVLYCKVRRDARTKVNGKIFDLINEKYNILIAAGSEISSSSVGFHNLAFLASGNKQALSDVSSLQAASKLLIRLHGSFMLAAWIGTASVGILLARYYRTTWTGSSLCGKDLWFAWHRMFMVLTWALTITGFILIFVELRAWSAENNPHAILGTITTIICFLQPIGAYFRPHPGTSKRPIFNWIHWLGGNAAHIVAIVTIFFAVKLTKAELPDFMDWILVAYVAFHVIIHLILSIMGCVAEKSSERKVTSFPMKDLGGSGRSSAYADRNTDAPYSGFRKFILGIYILIVLALVVALIVITALAPIEESWNNLRNSVMNS